MIIKSGDALSKLKETDKAIELYYRAYALTEPLSYDREGALERLIPLLREIGNDDAADDLVKREEKAREEKYKNFDTIPGSAARTPVALNPIPAKSLMEGTSPVPAEEGRNTNSAAGDKVVIPKPCQ